MAEGGYNFGDAGPDIEPDDPDDSDIEPLPTVGEGGYDPSTLNTTQPFDPIRTSTPYGEEVEMQNKQHEHSGLPEKSYQETSFGGVETPLLGDLLVPEEKEAEKN